MKRIRKYVIENIEHCLILAVLAVTLLVNYQLPGKTEFLNFYYLPVIIAGYYLGYRRAMLQAVLSILYVAIYVAYSPESFGVTNRDLGMYLHLMAWAGFLILAGAIVGRLADRLLEEIDLRRQAHTATIDALAMALDFRDQSTSGHSRRVAELTTGIAREIGVAQSELVQIEQGALLHDIGKLKIPDAILWKPESLTSDEWNIMRRHAGYGYDFVRNLEFLKDAAEIVRCHHEKFDGSGYPRGLSGKDIPIGARLFAIVDTYDALIFDRPYHKAVTFEEAAEEIRRSAGSHFDPALIEPALDYLRKYRDTHTALREDPSFNRFATPSVREPAARP